MGFLADAPLTPAFAVPANAADGTSQHSTADATATCRLRLVNERRVRQTAEFRARAIAKDIG
jgi:hypothetical protein